jgi:hypothetical protein
MIRHWIEFVDDSTVHLQKAGRRWRSISIYLIGCTIGPYGRLAPPEISRVGIYIAPIVREVMEKHIY